MKFTTMGLVIRILDIGEYHRSLTLLTADYGVLHAYCRGVRRVKSKRLAASSLLTYSEFVLSEEKGGLSVLEASPVEVFFGLRNDVAKLALAQYFCELFSEFAASGMPAPETMRLLLNSLYFLSTGKKEPAFIKPIAELRLLTETGFMPGLVSCRVCGVFESPEMFFCLSDGALVCSACPAPEGEHMLSPLSCIRALRHIVFSDFEKLFSFALPENDGRLLNAAVERYLLYVTERSFPSLEFYHTLID